MPDTNMLHDKLTNLIEKAEVDLLMEYRDRVYANMLIDAGQHKEACVHILEQFEYYKWRTDQEFYDMVAEVAGLLEVSESDYAFIKNQFKKVEPVTYKLVTPIPPRSAAE